MAKITLKDVRISFADDLWEASAYENQGTPKFGAQFLIPKDSATDKQIRALIAEVAKEAFGDKWKAKIEEFKGDRTRYCYRDGDAKEYDGYAGNMYLTAKNKTRPLVLDRDKSPLTQQDGKPYSGSYVNAQVDIWAQSKPPNQGIRCTLLGVQFSKDGDAFGAVSSADPNAFDDLSDGADSGDSDAAFA